MSSLDPSQVKYVLVTGATGFIGAHVVDVLLERGLRVRGASRSPAKAQAMLDARPQFAPQLDFVRIDDFGEKGDLSSAIEGVDAVIHVASPFTYDTRDNEKELILPAIAGVRSVLEAASSPSSTVRRVVVTSSFAAVLDAGRRAPPYFTYTAADWNPLTYTEAADPTTSAVIAYRGSKLFAERAAWDFVRDRSPRFDLVTLCPPMTFGPVHHPVSSAAALNESNAMLWKIASGAAHPLPAARVPFWIDVRDLAIAHVEAALRPEAGGRRFVPAAPERFSYGLAAGIIRTEFDWTRGRWDKGEEDQPIDMSHGIDGETAAKELGLEYHSFRQTVVDLVRQAAAMEESRNKNENKQTETDTTIV